MGAFAYDSYGAPGSNHELPDPTPQAGQVRVRVRAASLNPFDNFFVQGYMKDRMPTQLPLVPCADLSGTVDMLNHGDPETSVIRSRRSGRRHVGRLVKPRHRHHP